MRLSIHKKDLTAESKSVFQKPYERRMDVINTFKAVQSKIHNMDGGAGKLQTAVDHISDRIEKTDKPAAEKINTAGERLGMFLHNATATDRKVAAQIAIKQSAFFVANPWAIPPPPPKKKSAWQRFKDGCKKIGKAIVSGVKKAANWVKDKVKKAWKATVEFCKKHWKAIVKIAIGVVVIAGLAALSVFTGGAAAPLFALAAKGAAIAACSGAAVSVVSGVAQGKSAGEIFDSAADSFLVGSVTGAASGFAGAAAGAVTSATGSQLLGQLVETGINTGAKFLVKGASYAIDNGNLNGFMKKEGWGILKEGGLSCLSAAGGYLKNYGKDLLGKTFGGLKQSQLFNSFKNAYNWCQEKVPTLTNVVSNTFSKTFGDLSFSDLAKLKNPKEFAKGIGQSLLNNFTSEASGAVGDFINTDLNNITGGAVDKVKDYVSGIASDFTKSDFGKTISDAYKSVNGFVDSVKGEVSGVYDKLDTAFSGIKGQISGSLGGSTMDLIGKVTNGIGSSISGKVGNVISSVVGEFKGVVGNNQAIRMDLGSVISKLPGNLTDSVNNIKNVAEQSGGLLNGTIGNIGSKLDSYCSKISDSIASGSGLLGNGVKGIEGALGNVLNSTVGSIPIQIRPNFSALNNLHLNGNVGMIASKATSSVSALIQKNTNTALGLLSSKFRL